jgi:hypothetical protein
VLSLCASTASATPVIEPLGTGLLPSAPTEGVLVPGADADSATPLLRSVAVSAGPVARSASLVDDVMCKILTGGTIANAARNLIDRGAGKKWYGSLLADAVLATASYACPKVLRRAAKVVGAIFRNLRPGRSSSARTYDRALPDLEAQRVAQMISVNGVQTNAAYILRAVDDMCGDVSAGRNPVRSIARWFPGARLDLLSAMNGVISIAQRRCGLVGRFLVTLNAAMLQYMLSNTYRNVDLSPPAAWLTDARISRYSDGTAQVYLYFNGSDRGGSGVSDYAVWLNVGDGWVRYCFWPRTNCSVTNVHQNSYYQWAVQAIDREGNRGAFVYSKVFRA